MNGRMLPIALVAVLSMAGLAAADGGSSSPPSSPPPPSCGTAEHPCPPPSCSPDRPCPSSCPPGAPCSDPQFRECVQKTKDEAACKNEYCARTHSDWCARYCHEHPDVASCRGTGSPPTPSGDTPEGSRACMRNAGNDTASREKCVKEYCKAHMEDCKAFCHDHPRAAMCDLKPKGDESHIRFQADVDGRGITNLTVNGHLVLLSVRMDAPEPFEVQRDDHRVLVQAGDNRLELHDAASGFLRFEGTTATVTLVFPDGVMAESTPHGAKMHYPGGGLAMLESRNLTWDGGTATVTAFFSFHVAPGQGKAPHAGFENPEARGKYEAALAKGDRVGAEIHVNGGLLSEVFAFGQVDVHLKPPMARPTAADPLRVTLSANLTEGRTIVLHINKTMLDVEEGQVRLRYYDLPDGPNGTARTEVVFQRASSLDDILDPTDDAGQPEYWIVHDANGLQVMVTVPHWSTHMIELSSLADLVQPSVLVGIVAGAGAIALAAVVLFIPRRKLE